MSDVPDSSISRTRDDGLDDGGSSDFENDQRASRRVGGSGDPTDSPTSDAGRNDSRSSRRVGGTGGRDDDDDDRGRSRDDDNDDFRRDQQASRRVGGSGDPSAGGGIDQAVIDDINASLRVGGSGDPSAEPESATVDIGGADTGGQGPRVGISDQSPFADVRATAQLDTQTETDLAVSDVQISDGTATLTDAAEVGERVQRREQAASDARSQLRSDAAAQLDTPASNIDIERDGNRFVARQDLTDDQLRIDRATGGRFEGVVDAGRNLRATATETVSPVTDAGARARTRVQDVFAEVGDVASDVAERGRTQLTQAPTTLGATQSVTARTGQLDTDDVPDVSSREALAVGAAGVAAPEPTTSVGGAALAGAAVLGLGAAELQRRRQRGELETPDDRQPVFGEEIGVGEVNPTAEIDAPSQPQATRSELDVGDASGTGSELDVPDDPPTGATSEVDVPTVTATGATGQVRERQRDRGSALEQLRREVELNEETLEDVERTSDLPEGERLSQIRDQLERRQNEFVDPDIFDETRDPFVFPGSGGVGTQPATGTEPVVGEGVGTGLGTGVGSGLGSGPLSGVGLGVDERSDTLTDGLFGSDTITGVDVAQDQGTQLAQQPQLLSAQTALPSAIQTQPSTTSTTTPTQVVEPTQVTATPRPVAPGEPFRPRRPRRPEDDDDLEEFFAFSTETADDVFASGVLSGSQAVDRVFGDDR